MKELNNSPGKLLLIGIGNSGRSDDGLGWSFLEIIKESGWPFLEYEFRYQLQVEDAALIANYDVVVFVDASKELLIGGFRMEPTIAEQHYVFSTHAQEPGTILYLANHLYNKNPKTYTLIIEGREWDLKTYLSEEAETNLRSALAFFENSFLPALFPSRRYRSTLMGKRTLF